MLQSRCGTGSLFPAAKNLRIDSDIFIHAAVNRLRMNGDRVQVEKKKTTYRKRRRPRWGRNHRPVVKRARENVVGATTLDGQTFFSLSRPSDDKLTAKILDSRRRVVLKTRNKIVEVEITKFPTAAHWPSEKNSSASSDSWTIPSRTLVIIKKFGLPTSFPKEVEEDAQSFPMLISDEADLPGETDLRSAQQSPSIHNGRRRRRRNRPSSLPKAGQSASISRDVAHFVRTRSPRDTESIRGTSATFRSVIRGFPRGVSTICALLIPIPTRLARCDDAPLSRRRSPRSALHKQA